jgi:hypothetical protein
VKRLQQAVKKKIAFIGAYTIDECCGVLDFIGPHE